MNRPRFAEQAAASADRAIALTGALVAIPSPNPPGDVRACAEAAAIIGEAGSPRVLRFGEKGFLWLEVEAEGRASHGAHVHLGVNALDRLCAALDAVRALRHLRPAAPPAVTAAIAAAQPISEP